MDDSDRALREADRITAEAVAMHLIKKGWYAEEPRGGLLVFSKDLDGADSRVFAILPLDPNASDRRTRVAAAIRTISEVEELSVETIAREIASRMAPVQPTAPANQEDVVYSPARHRRPASSQGASLRSPPSTPFRRQTTLRAQATVVGIGVHSGLPVTLTLGPAPIDAGFVFIRTGLDGPDRDVQATADQVVATDFATVLGDRNGPLVSTTEHVLAALRGMEVDNATIEIDGPEVPIMDGSAAAFVAAIDQAGIVDQARQSRFIQVLKPISVEIGDSFGEIRPYANGFRVEVEIDFADIPIIGQQSYAFDLNPERFRREISRARNFLLMGDVARLWNEGLALGSSFENTVVFDGERLINPEGLRYVNECVRHKALEVVGELALAGLPILGAYRSVRGGSRLNFAVLESLLADRDAWRVVEAGKTARRSLNVLGKQSDLWFADPLPNRKAFRRLLDAVIGVR